MTDHNFADSQAFEKRCRNKMDSIYMTYFGGLELIKVITNLDLQLRGHDVHLVFSDKTWIIDEKVRRRDYSDILIEYLSNKETGRRGWIYQNESDYLAYLFPTKGFWMLETQKIKMWVANPKSNFWSSQFDDISAENTGKYGQKYTTISKAIPFSVLERLGFVYHKVLGISGCIQ